MYDLFPIPFDCWERRPIDWDMRVIKIQRQIDLKTIGFVSKQHQSTSTPTEITTTRSVQIEFRPRTEAHLRTLSRVYYTLHIVPRVICAGSLRAASIKPVRRASASARPLREAVCAGRWHVAAAAAAVTSSHPRVPRSQQHSHAHICCTRIHAMWWWRMGEA